MYWNGKRFHTLNYELQKLFNTKVIKLSLNGGFTCPNRDGKIDTRGCLFCNEKGSGDFTSGNNTSINEQINYQKKILSYKWSKGKYIAYFQSFTNTYSDINNLKEKYYSAMSDDSIIGLAVATRPDCLDDDILELLSQINKSTFLWVELGLQTIHEETARLIRRGYKLSTFTKTVEQLKKLNIKTVVHIIYGLPGETRKNMLDTAKYISRLGIWGIKIHLLYILLNSNLYEYYLKYPFHILTKEEYVSLISDTIKILPPDLVIHRLTGDAPHKDLYAPLWSKNKWNVLNSIDKELEKRNIFQGIAY